MCMHEKACVHLSKLFFLYFQFCALKVYESNFSFFLLIKLIVRNIDRISFFLSTNAPCVYVRLLQLPGMGFFGYNRRLSLMSLSIDFKCTALVLLRYGLDFLFKSTVVGRRVLCFHRDGWHRMRVSRRCLHQQLQF